MLKRLLILILIYMFFAVPASIIIGPQYSALVFSIGFIAGGIATILTEPIN